MGSAPGIDPAAQGIGDGRHPLPDCSGSDDAEAFALQLKAHQPVLGSPGAAGPVAGEQISGEGNGHTEHQLGNGGGGIARAVADGDSTPAAVFHIHMVGTGEGHADHFQLGAAADNRLPIGEIGEHDNVGVLAALNKLGLVDGPGVVVNELVGLPHGLTRHVQQLGFIHAHRLKIDDFHSVPSVFR
ncbi:hypothetical protein SDC9_169174 [bioreactor metagenome]|uniref:Uncharacterized protein n=1 Tax=bioreactor metagenome TaxID=1076179 RepID=A0A645GCQ4_9ZZZZ